MTKFIDIDTHMISFPHCKINLGLHVTERRNDGFHELETIFYPVKWNDILELTEGGHKPFNLNISGLNISGDLKSNLLYKAWAIIKNDHALPPITVHLHKILPMGAGLGGGSSDAAFMLKMLNDHFKLAIPTSKLTVMAAQLGSDCAFFIEETPKMATGRGEILSPISIDLSPYSIVIVMPPTTVGTSEAYSWITPKQPKASLKVNIEMPISEWKNYLINDFEEPVMKHRPIIREIKNSLYEKGAIYASMSGSGAAVFGIFDKNEKPAIEIGNCIVNWEEE